MGAEDELRAARTNDPSRKRAFDELGVLSAQCLDRRIPNKQTLIDEIAAWERERHAQCAGAAYLSHQ